ncbi:hypothetical protein ACP4OV_002459 [Aristida adscensionis]
MGRLPTPPSPPPLPSPPPSESPATAARSVASPSKSLLGAQRPCLEHHQQQDGVQQEDRRARDAVDDGAAQTAGPSPAQLQLRPLERRLGGYRALSELADQAAKHAEMARHRELHTIKGHIESVVVLKGLDVDTI